MHDELHFANAGNGNGAINSRKAETLSKRFGDKHKDGSLIKERANSDKMFIRQINSHTRGREQDFGARRFSDNKCVATTTLSLLGYTSATRGCGCRRLLMSTGLTELSKYNNVWCRLLRDMREDVYNLSQHVLYWNSSHSVSSLQWIQKRAFLDWTHNYWIARHRTTGHARLDMQDWTPHSWTLHYWTRIAGYRILDTHCWTLHNFIPYVFKKFVIRCINYPHLR